MNNYDDMNQKSNMIIYTTEDGLTKIETTFDEDTVWLSIDQMAELFQRDKSTISRHIKNVFSEGELQRESVVANFATTAADGKTYPLRFDQEDVGNFRISRFKRAVMVAATEKQVSLTNAQVILEVRSQENTVVFRNIYAVEH